MSWWQNVLPQWGGGGGGGGNAANGGSSSSPQYQQVVAPMTSGAPLVGFSAPVGSTALGASPHDVERYQASLQMATSNRLKLQMELEHGNPF